MEAFAVLGEAEAGNTSTQILVAGDPDDYAVELEELLEAKFELVFKACSQRPTKVLRLLKHLENPKAFNKFVDRDFPGFVEHDEAERRRVQAQRVAEEKAAQAQVEAARR